MELSFGKLILGAISGSVAYGTQTENSDIDLKGIYIHKKKDFFGYRELDTTGSSEDFHNFLKPKIPSSLACYAANKVEGTALEFRHFLRLAAKCNPNILECLFCEQEDVLYFTNEGKLLLENKHLFLSQLAKSSYFGYAKHQANNGNITFEVVMKLLNLSDELKHVGMARAKIYKQLSHCYRLLSCGLDLLQKGDLCITDEFRTSLAIRSGAVSNEKIAELISGKFKEFNDFDLKKSPLPEKPDYDKINELCYSVLTQSYGSLVDK